MRKIVTIFAFLAVASLALAQTNPLQDNVRVRKLYRYNRVQEDSTLNLGGIAGLFVDSLQVFRPAKWTTLYFSVTGTLTPDVITAVAHTGFRQANGTYFTVPQDTLVISSTGRYAWPLNIPTSDAVLAVFTAGASIGGATVIDTITVVENW